jgi:hypothetical protein
MRCHLAGAHIGAPLQTSVNLSSYSVGADLCVCGQLLGALPLRAAHAWSPLSGKAAKGISQARAPGATFVHGAAFRAAEGGGPYRYGRTFR